MNEQNRSDAYEILQITEDAVASAPKITRLLTAAGISTNDREFDGEPATVWDYLESSEEPEARAIIAARALLKVTVAPSVPFEAFCVAAGVTTKKALGIIQSEVFDQAGKSAELLTSAAYASVVQHTVTMALTPQGTKEKEFILKNRNFLPVPKNTFNLVKGNQTNIDTAQNVAILPAFDATVKGLGDRFLDSHVTTIPQIEPAPDDDYEADNE